MLIMLYIYWTTIILLYVTAANVHCLTDKNEELRVLYMSLNDDGTLKYPNKVPDCGSGRNIFLISYSYQKRQCHYECRTVEEKPMPNADIMLLHVMCSMKEKCINLSFSKRSEELRMKTNSVKLTYQCVDFTRSVVNICQKSTIDFSGPVFLTATESARFYEKCECFINHDNFTVRVEDIRLYNILEKKCSMTILLINSEEFKCNAEKNGFGSVFKRTVVDTASNAFLSLMPHSSTDFLDMILITVMPKGTARIICKPKLLRTVLAGSPIGAKMTPAVIDSVETVSSINNIINEVTVSSSSNTQDCTGFKSGFIAMTIPVGVCVLAGILYCIRRTYFKKRRLCGKDLQNAEENQSLSTTRSENLEMDAEVHTDQGLQNWQHQTKETTRQACQTGRKSQSGKDLQNAEENQLLSTTRSENLEMDAEVQTDQGLQNRQHQTKETTSQGCQTDRNSQRSVSVISMSSETTNVHITTKKTENEIIHIELEE